MHRTAFYKPTVVVNSFTGSSGKSNAEVARPNDLRWAHKQALDSRTENKVCQHFQGQRRILRRRENIVVSF
jgi:hypothetical protein